ncbi:hypothetical protein [Streptomyces sp. NPDC000410]|uniref:hypothetical protein n=1 Tax=Streptomyces sp. NPDC000410 TaxID=3154254 RepID=UPI00332E369A
MTDSSSGRPSRTAVRRTGSSSRPAARSQQTLVEPPQVVAHYAPSTGYFPLPWWAGIAVLCAYAVLLLGLALKRLPQSDARAGQPVDWR